MQIVVRIISGIMVIAAITVPFLTYGIGKGGFLASFSEQMPENQIENSQPYIEEAYEKLAQREAPLIHAKSQKVELNRVYDLFHFIDRAIDFSGAVILDQVRVSGENVTEDGKFEAEKPGVYRITYTVYDKEGLKGEKSILLIAEEKREGSR